MRRRNTCFTLAGLRLYTAATARRRAAPGRFPPGRWCALAPVPASDAWRMRDFNLLESSHDQTSCASAAAGRASSELPLLLLLSADVGARGGDRPRLAPAAEALESLYSRARTGAMRRRRRYGRQHLGRLSLLQLQSPSLSEAAFGCGSPGACAAPAQGWQVASGAAQKRQCRAPQVAGAALRGGQEGRDHLAQLTGYAQSPVLASHSHRGMWRSAREAGAAIPLAPRTIGRQRQQGRRCPAAYAGS